MTMETRQLILIRGSSGTGKTTIANSIISEQPNSSAAFHETDQFFTDTQDDYHFNIGKLKQAHAWNQLQTERSMLHEIPVVIVANTFIAHWELETYLELAEEYKYDVRIIRTPGPWEPEVLFKRNKHAVPLDVIKRHVNGYKPHEKDEEWTDLSVFKQ